MKINLRIVGSSYENLIGAQIRRFPEQSHIRLALPYWLRARLALLLLRRCRGELISPLGRFRTLVLMFTSCFAFSRSLLR